MTDTIDNHMIMKCMAYQNGVSLGDVTIDSISEVPKREHTFVWLGLHTARLAGDQIEFWETHFYLGPRFLVAVRQGYSSSHSSIRNRCESKPRKLAKGPGFALYSITDFIVANYVPIIDGLQTRFNTLELAIFSISAQPSNDGRSLRTETQAAPSARCHHAGNGYL